MSRPLHTFFRYLPISQRDRLWGLRVIREHQLVYISVGQGARRRPRSADGRTANPLLSAADLIDAPAAVR